MPDAQHQSRGPIESAMGPNGVPEALQVDANGNLFVTGTLTATVTGLVNSGSVSIGSFPGSTLTGSMGTLPGVIKASGGSLFSLAVTNRNALSRYVGVFNSLSGPTGVPLASFLVPANTGSLELGRDFFGPAGASLSTGISLGVSTSPTTYVAATAGDTDWACTFS